MDAIYTPYSTSQLIGAYGVLDRPKQFLYETFFSKQIVFNTAQVFFDKVSRARKLAPIVSPTVEGKAEKLRSYSTLAITPPYVKAKHAIDPTKLMTRVAGEALTGDMTLAERRQWLVADALMIQDDQISRTEEYLASQLLLNGAININSPDYGPINIDMQRPASNTVTLGAGLTWGSTGVDPLSNLIDFSTTVQSVSGVMPNVVVMDPKAYNLFRKSAGVAQIMTAFNQQSGYIDLAGKAVGANGNEAQFVGKVGQHEIWVYQQFFTDDNGVVKQIMPDNTIIMGSTTGCEGVRLYGAILDHDGLIAAPRFPKMWYSPDPSAAYLMTQSAPLPMLGWSQATLRATVA